MAFAGRVLGQDNLTGPDFTAIAIAYGDCEAPREHNNPLLAWGDVHLPVRCVPGRFDKFNFAASERTRNQERWNAIHDMCEDSLEFDILKAGIAIIGSVDSKVPHNLCCCLFL